MYFQAVRLPPRQALRLRRRVCSAVERLQAQVEPLFQSRQASGHQRKGKELWAAVMAQDRDIADTNVLLVLQR